jgi:hypothetical protein
LVDRGTREEVLIMRRYRVLRWLPGLAVPAAVVLAPALLIASDRIKGAGKFNSQDETVEIFSAMEAGQLEVKLIPKDARQCRLLIRNKTDKPLNVTLPDAFAGVPVLAQGLWGDGNLNRNGNVNANNISQQIGIGNPMGNNFQGNRGNQFFNMRGRRGLNDPGWMFAPFNIAPEKVAQLKLKSVCLDHGRPDPRPAIPYQVRPLASVSEKAELGPLCRMLGQEAVGQRAAQAAAWHLHSEMSWKQLAALRVRVHGLGPTSRPFFTSRELDEAKKAVEKAAELAKKDRKAAKTDSLSLR